MDLFGQQQEKRILPLDYREDSLSRYRPDYLFVIRLPFEIEVPFNSVHQFTESKFKLISFPEKGYSVYLFYTNRDVDIFTERFLIQRMTDYYISQTEQGEFDVKKR